MSMEDWEEELADVEEGAARDTIPAPPPTEPHHEPPDEHAQCVHCGETERAPYWRRDEGAGLGFRACCDDCWQRIGGAPA